MMKSPRSLDLVRLRPDEVFPAAAAGAMDVRNAGSDRNRLRQCQPSGARTLRSLLGRFEKPK
jgi:hypothetical protein